MTMKKSIVFALAALAVAGTATWLLLKKRKQTQTCCHYDADDMEDDDYCCEGGCEADACGADEVCGDCCSCSICEEDLDIAIPEEPAADNDAPGEECETVTDEADVTEEKDTASKDAAE